MKRSASLHGRRVAAGGCLLSVALLSACTSPGLDRGETLASIGPAALPAERTGLPQVSNEQVVQQYRALLGDSVGAELKARIMQRLAGLEMQRSELQQIAAEAPRQHYDRAIALYPRAVIMTAFSINWQRLMILTVDWMSPANC
jgi:hypothetical protein